MSILQLEYEPLASQHRTVGKLDGNPGGRLVRGTGEVLPGGTHVLQRGRRLLSRRSVFLAVEAKFSPSTHSTFEEPAHSGAVTPIEWVERLPEGCHSLGQPLAAMGYAC